MNTHRPTIEHAYDQLVGGSRPERDIAQARTAYIATANRFVNAFGAFIATGVPLDPGTNPRHVNAWTRADIAAVLELHTALGEMIRARRAYDGLHRNR